MEHLVKLLRNSYDLQEEKSEQSAYWHLQQLRSQIKQLIITDVVKPFYCIDTPINGKPRCRIQCDNCKHRESKMQ
jgi:hypothetical protein